MEYSILFTKQAEKDVRELSPKLKTKLKALLTEVVAKNPHSGKKLVGELKGSYSLRLTYKDRVVYSINDKQKTVYIERAKTHYGE